MADQVVIDTTTEETNPSLEEQAAQMEADGKLQPEGQPEERPEWLPEKFNSPEDMAQAYSELESKMGQRAPQEAQEAEDAAREAVENVGLDFDAYSAEYAETGELSADTYDALAKAGIPQSIVDQYIEAQSVAAEFQQSQVFSEVGGQSNYGNMMEWATNNLSESEIDSYNAVMDSGDIEQIMMSVRGLSARYSTSEGIEPSRTIGGDVSTGSSVYRSVAEMMTDMQDPRYKSDPAFRRDVEQKLGRSDIL